MEWFRLSYYAYISASYLSAYILTRRSDCGRCISVKPVFGCVYVVGEERKEEYGDRKK